MANPNPVSTTSSNPNISAIRKRNLTSLLKRCGNGELEKEFGGQFTISPVYDAMGNIDMNTWSVIIIGPEGTPYAGGQFHISITCGPEYPIKPPTCVLNTPTFHPNICGFSICLNILKSDWSPSWSLDKIALALIALLEFPVPEDALDPMAANMNDRQAFNERVIALVKKNKQ
jgi:ubiquitin-conjugating enzyme E2 D/E